MTVKIPEPVALRPAVPRRAMFDDLRVGQEVVWTAGGKFDGGGTVVGFLDGRVQVIHEAGSESVHRGAAWVILREPPAAPVTVRREDYDALKAALPTDRGAAIIAAANTLIDNADTGDGR